MYLVLLMGLENIVKCLKSKMNRYPFLLQHTGRNCDFGLLVNELTLLVL
jgi:hypothetical protein